MFDTGCVKYSLPPSGWIFKQGVDSSGTDCGYTSGVNGDWAKAIAACDSYPGCMAVNTGGWSKCKISSYRNTGTDEPCSGLLERGSEYHIGWVGVWTQGHAGHGALDPAADPRTPQADARCPLQLAMADEL